MKKATRLDYEYRQFVYLTELTYDERIKLIDKMADKGFQYENIEVLEDGRTRYSFIKFN